MNLLAKTDIDSLQFIQQENSLTRENTICLISSVADTSVPELPYRKIYIRDYLIENNFLDMHVDYANSIGDDRLINAYYAFKKNSNKTTLIIDSGTFTTVDIIEPKGFLGGYILPGIAGIKSLYKTGEKLTPHISNDITNNSFNSQIPTNSLQAIEQGIIATSLLPIHFMIERFCPQEIIVTGGNAILILQSLKKLPRDENTNIDLIPDLAHKALYDFSKRITI